MLHPDPQVLPESEEMENPLSWIKMLEPHIQPSAKTSNEECMEDFVKRVLKTMEEIDKAENLQDSDLGNYWKHRVSRIASAINKAALYAFTGDWTNAFSLLDTIPDSKLNELKNVDKIQCQVIQLCRDTLIFLWECENLRGDGSKRQAELKHRWEGVKEIDKSMIALMKGMLARKLIVNDAVTLQFFEEATSGPVDSQNPLYHHHAYRRIRRVRKKVDRRLAALPAPCTEQSPEAQLAEKQYKLFPNDMIAVLNYALMLRETRHTERAVEVVELFEQALDIAKQENNAFWTAKIKLDMAEHLVFGKCDVLDRSRGHELYMECERERIIETSFVCHKLGKYFKRLHMKERAMEYCKLGLEKDPTNFCCLMDYLKLVRDDVHKMMATIDKTLKDYPLHEEVVAKLHIMRGYLIWAHQCDEYKPEDAVASWIHVLKDIPSQEQHVYDCITNPSFSAFLLYHREENKSTHSSTKDDITDAVAGYLKRKIRTYGENRKLVRNFIENLERLQRRPKKHYFRDGHKQE